MYIFRSQGFSSTEVEDLVTYLLALRLPEIRTWRPMAS